MSFLSLPAELQVRIITECIRARQVTPSFFVPRRDDPSVKQATGLALVSRRFNALVASILFRNIRLTRPSSLLEIQATLRKRPELAALIVKLHIGPDNELLGKGWPIETDGRVPIRTTLSEDDEETLPLWCEPGTKFDINSSKGTCQAMAVDKAIRRAMYDIDVEPLQRGYSVRGKSIGVRAWAARLCLLQAAVDIYLIKMRYVEDVRHYTVSSWYERDYEAQRRWTQLQCKTATCTHYPRLEVLHDSSTSPLPEHINHFNVTQGQLWQHLLRRGGAADHFDHLVRLTRSTPQSLGMVPAGGDEWRRVKLALGGPYSHADADTLPTSGAEDGNPPRQSDLHDSESEDGDTFPSWVDDESDLESAPPRGWRAAPHPLDGQRVEDLLHACRSVLRLTTNLKTLSLTSYLHRALPYISDPKQLGCCVIGPRARYWDDVLPFEGPLRLDSLARLRVVGMMSQGDAAKVTELPLLQKVEWVLPVKDVSERK